MIIRIKSEEDYWSHEDPKVSINGSEFINTHVLGSVIHILVKSCRYNQCGSLEYIDLSGNIDNRGEDVR